MATCGTYVPLSSLVPPRHIPTGLVERGSRPYLRPKPQAPSYFLTTVTALVEPQDSRPPREPGSPETLRSLRHYTVLCRQETGSPRGASGFLARRIEKSSDTRADYHSMHGVL